MRRVAGSPLVAGRPSQRHIAPLPFRSGLSSALAVVRTALAVGGAAHAGNHQRVLDSLRPRKLVAALAATARLRLGRPASARLASALGLPFPPRPFVEPVRHCQSFSAWFSRLSGFADAGFQSSRICSDPGVRLTSCALSGHGHG